jgi:hypothetical protein
MWKTIWIDLSCKNTFIRLRIYLSLFNKYFCKHKKSKLRFVDRAAILNNLFYGMAGVLCVLGTFFCEFEGLGKKKSKGKKSKSFSCLFFPLCVTFPQNTLHWTLAPFWSVPIVPWKTLLVLRVESYKNDIDGKNLNMVNFVNWPFQIITWTCSSASIKFAKCSFKSARSSDKLRHTSMQL